MELITEVSCGDWLRERIGGWARVGGVAGAGFEAYARILHPVPVHREDLTVADRWGMHPVLEEGRWPWSRVAARQGLTMHPLVQWNRLADLHQGVDFADGWRVGQSRDGSLDVDLLAGLTGHLREATRSPEQLVVGIWAGWSELSGTTVVHERAEDGDAGTDAEVEVDARMRRHLEEQRTSVAPDVATAARRGPLLELPGREYVLLATGCDEPGRRDVAAPGGHRVDLGLRRAAPAARLACGPRLGGRQRDRLGQHDRGRVPGARRCGAHGRPLRGLRGRRGQRPHLGGRLGQPAAGRLVRRTLKPLLDPTRSVGRPSSVLIQRW
ncbi:hypothetical protein [Janibacter indicus]|uniref:hypothetical protein n=1 Tax=Janibacter indicus TaxID=857417 RepID=UPI003D9A6CDD